MMNHLTAERHVALLGLTPNESLYERMVAWFETKYSEGWKDGGEGSNNFGAETVTMPDQYSFQHGDSSADAGSYVTWFAGYPDEMSGWRGLARVLLKPNVRAALARNDWMGAVRAQYSNGYFMGMHTHKTPEGNEANVRDYASNLASAMKDITDETGERPVGPVEVSPGISLFGFGVAGLALVVALRAVSR